MAREPGVVHGLDLRVISQELGDREGVLLVLAHADGEGLEAAEHDPGVERPRYPAGSVLVELHSLVEVRVRRDYGPTDHVGVAAHVLRRRVDHYVRPQSERVLEIRRGEGVIYRDYRAALARHPRETGYVREGQHRVGRRLDP